MPEPIAGAIGCGIDPLQPRAHMVVDVGGGTAEVSAFCFGGILATRSCRIAGDEMTLALHQYLRQEHQLMVGELTAEDIKIRFRDAAAEGQPLVVEGRDVLSSRPRLITLDPKEIADALRPTVDGIVEALTGCLEDLPPQAVGDIMHEGVIAFGGGFLLAGFEQRLEEEFGFSVHHAERAADLRGGGGRPGRLHAGGHRRVLRPLVSAAASMAGLPAAVLGLGRTEPVAVTVGETTGAGRGSR